MAEPSETAVKWLFAHSRNLCFFNLPGEQQACEKTLTERHFKRARGEIAHIRSDSVTGPRYDPNQTDSERQAEANLMLLCPDCHKRIDFYEPDRFTVDELVAMKERHLIHESDFSPDEATIDVVTKDMISYLREIRRGTAPPFGSASAAAFDTTVDTSQNLLDEAGEPLLDESGQPLLDEG